MHQRTLKTVQAASLKLFFVLVIASSFLLAGQNTVAQPPKEAKSDQKPAAAKPPDPKLMRWRIVLDSLAQDAKTVFPEDRRPYAMMDVASAYWELDRTESQAMFVSALDSASKLAAEDKKYRDTVDDVLQTASKVDITLAKSLSARLAEKSGEKKTGYDIAVSNLFDLLKEDPEKAAELAEAFAPDGLPLSAPLFIYALAKVNQPLADRVYGVYVDKLNKNSQAADSSVPVANMLPLASYAFGYSEYYTMDKRGDAPGMQMLPVKGLGPNRQFAVAVQNMIYRQLTREFNQRENAVGPDIAARTWVLLFATQYLVPEVARFDPSRLPEWEELERRARVGATPEQLKAVESSIDSIVKGRERLRGISDSADKLDELAEATLNDIDKVVGTCERDVLYMKAALNFSYRKNFKRAQELLSKVEGEQRAESLRNTVFFKMVTVATENGEWDDAELYLKKVSVPEMKALAQIEMAEAMIKNGDKAAGTRIADLAAAGIAKLAEPKDRAGLYFSLAPILLKAAPTDSRTLFDKAVKDLNKLDPKDGTFYLYLMKVPLNCTGDKNGEWYGGSYSPNGSNIFASSTLFAKDNPDETSSIVEAISDKVTKIRAQAIVAKIALQGLKKQPVR